MEFALGHGLNYLNDIIVKILKWNIELMTSRQFKPWAMYVYVFIKQPFSKFPLLMNGRKNASYESKTCIHSFSDLLIILLILIALRNKMCWHLCTNSSSDVIFPEQRHFSWNDVILFLIIAKPIRAWCQLEFPLNKALAAIMNAKYSWVLCKMLIR